MYNFYTVYILMQLTQLDTIESFNEKKKLIHSCIDKIVWDREKKCIVEIVIRPKNINVNEFDVLVGEFRDMIKKVQDKPVDELVKYTKDWFRKKKGLVFFKGKEDPVVFKNNISSKSGKLFQNNVEFLDNYCMTIKTIS